MTPPPTPNSEYATVSTHVQSYGSPSKANFRKNKPVSNILTLVGSNGLFLAMSLNSICTHHTRLNCNCCHHFDPNRPTSSFATLWKAKRVISWKAIKVAKKIQITTFYPLFWSSEDKIWASSVDCKWPPF